MKKVILLSLLPFTAMAASTSIKGIGNYQDWDLVCDNRSLGACLHALCGWATEETLGIHNAEEMLSATGAVASTIAITSVYYFFRPRRSDPDRRCCRRSAVCTFRSDLL